MFIIGVKKDTKKNKRIENEKSPKYVYKAFLKRISLFLDAINPRKSRNNELNPTGLISTSTLNIL